MISKDKAKCYIYTRVSTAIQVDGYSLDAQRETMRKYADFQNTVGIICPRPGSKGIWVGFQLGKDSAVIMKSNMHTRKLNMPVYSFDKC